MSALTSRDRVILSHGQGVDYHAIQIGPSVGEDRVYGTGWGGGDGSDYLGPGGESYYESLNGLSVGVEIGQLCVL